MSENTNENTSVESAATGKEGNPQAQQGQTSVVNVPQQGHQGTPQTAEGPSAQQPFQQPVATVQNQQPVQQPVANAQGQQSYQSYAAPGAQPGPTPAQQPFHPQTQPPAQPPSAGAPAKKPIFKKWWFWVIIAVVVIAIFGSMGGNGSKSSNSSSGEAASASADASAKSAEPGANLESISAEYTGKTDEGVELKKGTSGLKVTGTYSDGSTKEITDYTVENPTKLQAGQTVTLNIAAAEKTCTLDVTCTSMTPDQFKGSCQPVDYQTLARDPDSWKGKNIVVRGKVVQVQENSGGFLSGKENMYRISITEGQYGTWTDAVIVNYKPAESASRIIEDDIVTVYGTSTGLYTYTTVFGASQTVPSISASYIDVG